jgi:hypothetical protein
LVTPIFEGFPNILLTQSWKIVIKDGKKDRKEEGDN